MSNLSRKRKALVLLSGGIDSATTLYLAKEKKYKVTALIFDYRQRHRKEIECAKKIAQYSRVEYHLEKINLSWVKSSLTNRRINVPRSRRMNNRSIPLTYVAGRNIIFLSYAVSFAESLGAKKVFIGVHTQDYSGYPDCRPQFIKSFQQAIRRGMKNQDIKIVTPLVNKNKKDIIRLGRRLGVPFQYTWSCYRGGRKPCLRCDSCRFRAKGFQELGLADPLLNPDFAIDFRKENLKTP